METLLSVGIDMGTSTTQLVFSEITVENRGNAFTVPKMEISDKKVIYRSKIYFTPLISHDIIDMEGIRSIIEKEYKNAGIDKDRIDTGAVIITGETARKENAEAVTRFMSDFAGEFVVATAGPDLESIIAGKGAGTAELSEKMQKKVMNIDIGGGTSNFALFDSGRVTETGCMDIGGRLVKIRGGEITYVAPKIKELIKGHGLGIVEGKTAYISELEKLAELMTKILMQGVFSRKRDRDFELLITNKMTESIPDLITFSGGVADCMTEPAADAFKYGDIGILLGKAIRNSPLWDMTVKEGARETIRATVVGAGAYTTEISGSTITYDGDLLPVKNLPVFKIKNEENMDISQVEDMVAFAISGIKNPTFRQIEKYAEELAKAKVSPVVIIIKEDMAKALGQSLRLKGKKDIICIDGINTDSGDYVDIGKPVAGGTVLPVVVKTLVFDKF